MTFTLESNFSAPSGSRTTPSAHKRSSSSSSTSSTTSTSSSTSSNGGHSLRERRGVSFRLSFTGAQTPAPMPSPKHQPELPLSNVPRGRRALPMPVAVFNYDAVMGKAGAKSARARDYGMGEDGWTVVLS